MVVTIVTLIVAVLALTAYLIPLQRTYQKNVRLIESLQKEVLEKTSDKNTEINVPIEQKTTCSRPRYTALATFDGNKWTTDECSVLVPEELLLALPKQEGRVTITPRGGLDLIEHISASVDPIDDEALEMTRRFFGEQETVLDESVAKYSYYVWSFLPFEASIEGITRQLPGKKLIQITSFYWGTSFSSCFAELSVYDGILDVRCGGGDNACTIFHRLRIDIFDQSFEDRGVCANSCDLVEGDTYKIICGKGEIIPPWRQ